MVGHGGGARPDRVLKRVKTVFGLSNSTITFSWEVPWEFCRAVRCCAVLCYPVGVGFYSCEEPGSFSRI